MHARAFGCVRAWCVRACVRARAVGAPQDHMTAGQGYRRMHARRLFCLPPHLPSRAGPDLFCMVRFVSSWWERRTQVAWQPRSRSGTFLRVFRSDISSAAACRLASPGPAVADCLPTSGRHEPARKHDRPGGVAPLRPGPGPEPEENPSSVQGAQVPGSGGEGGGRELQLLMEHAARPLWHWAVCLWACPGGPAGGAVGMPSELPEGRENLRVSP